MSWEIIMITQEYKRVLHKLFSRLKDIDVNWVITGSINFALQGIPTKPNDIDIQTSNYKSASKIEHLFSKANYKI